MPLWLARDRATGPRSLGAPPEQILLVWWDVVTSDAWPKTEFPLCKDPHPFCADAPLPGTARACAVAAGVAGGSHGHTCSGLMGSVVVKMSE